MPARKKIDLEKVNASLGHALPAVRIPDSAGRTAQNQFNSSPLPEVRSHFHHKRNGLNPAKLRVAALLSDGRVEPYPNLNRRPPDLQGWTILAPQRGGEPANPPLN